MYEIVECKNNKQWIIHKWTNSADKRKQILWDVNL